jgi:hypothetical protein
MLEIIHKGGGGGGGGAAAAAAAPASSNGGGGAAPAAVGAVGAAGPGGGEYLRVRACTCVNLLLFNLGFYDMHVIFITVTGTVRFTATELSLSVAV